MTTTNPNTPAPGDNPSRRIPLYAFIVGFILAAGITATIAWFLTTIYTRKMEAKNPYVRLREVDNNTTDPAIWGVNWPREYDSYLRTVDTTRTRYGGSEAMPEQKLDRDPWLKKLFAGYAFSIDYRDRRGHAYMLSDQERTERVLKKPQPGTCLNCHASLIPTMRRLGIAAQKNIPIDTPAAAQIQLPAYDFDWPAVMAGFDAISKLNYTQAHAQLLLTPDGSGAQPAAAMPATAPTTQEALAHQAGRAHPVSCVDCHDPKSMELRVTRPGFVKGIQALAASNVSVPHLASIQRWREGGRKSPYDPNADASRQEMRSYVCAQCHVEYYCGPKENLLFPWANGLTADQIESFYDGHKFPTGEHFYDWKHGITGAPVYKAQHPEFETWSQGVHARSGVACADCHMPYKREGAMKVSDHWIRSPMLMVNRSCQTCHPYPEEELRSRVTLIQSRTAAQIERAGRAVSDMTDAILLARKNGATDQQLQPALDLQRRGQWRLDFVYAENSMGFHASQETARVLGDAIDYMRQSQLAAESLRLGPAHPVTVTTQPVEGITPTPEAPPGPYKTQPKGP